MSKHEYADVVVCGAEFAPASGSARPVAGLMIGQWAPTGMHEVGIMEEALALVERHATAHHAVRIERIVLRVGVLSGVDLEALRFAFEAVAPQTCAAGAVLEIEEVPAVIHCGTCGHEFTAAGSFAFTCPHCAALCGDIRRGRELELSRIEMT